MKKIFLLTLAIIANTNYVIGDSSIQLVSTEIPQTTYSTTDNLADVVAQLLPCVVNISTIQYPRHKFNKKNYKNFNDENSSDLFNELYKRFNIIPPQQFNESFTDREVISLGSGFIIDPRGYIVTNNHVIKDADEVTIKMYDGTEVIAKIIGSDARTDLALLKIDYNQDLPCLKFADSTKVRTGDPVIAIGNPFRLGGTVTKGIVSSAAREVDIMASGIVEEYIQTDAAMNKGNSGGPLLNLKGEVIGVNTAIHANSGGGNIGIGFAIPASIASNIVNQLIDNGKISRGMLSIKIQAISNEMAESLNMSTPMGALVVEVEKGEAGDKAGLQIGDIIIRFNNIDIKTSNKLPRLVAEAPLGKKIKMVVLRNGKKIELEAIINENKSTIVVEKKSMPKVDNKAEIAEYHGITFSNLNNNIQSKFGISENAKGILVIDVEFGSSWARKGLIKGDLITAINQQPILTTNDFTNIYNQAMKDKRKNILLLVQRQDTTCFIAVPLSNDN